MTIRSDLSYLDHAYRAKRTGQSRVEYSAAIEGYTRPTTWKTKALWLAALAVLAGAVYLGAR